MSVASELVVLVPVPVVVVAVVVGMLVDMPGRVVSVLVEVVRPEDP